MKTLVIPKMLGTSAAPEQLGRRSDRLASGPPAARPTGPASQPGAAKQSKLCGVALDFTAVDFETANGFIGSACSVGLVKVRAGRIVETEQWLMKPPVGFDHFDPRNVSIHHITPDMVAAAPRVDEAA